MGAASVTPENRNLLEAKRRLRHAHTGSQRNKAVEIAFVLGMSLRQIEDYLTWVDMREAGNQPQTYRLLRG